MGDTGCSWQQWNVQLANVARVNDFIIEDFHGNAGARRDWADVNKQSTGVEKMTSGGGVGKHSFICRREEPVGTILLVESDVCKGNDFTSGLGLSWAGVPLS